MRERTTLLNAWLIIAGTSLLVSFVYANNISKMRTILEKYKVSTVDDNRLLKLDKKPRTALMTAKTERQLGDHSDTTMYYVAGAMHATLQNFLYQVQTVGNFILFGIVAFAIREIWSRNSNVAGSLFGGNSRENGNAVLSAALGQMSGNDPANAGMMMVLANPAAGGTDSGGNRFSMSESSKFTMNDVSNRFGSNDVVVMDSPTNRNSGLQTTDRYFVNYRNN